MSSDPFMMLVPYDSKTFQMPVWELLEYSEAALAKASKTPGHYTVRVPPLADKSILQRYGFYYCDTLLRPFCSAHRFRPFQHEDASVSKKADAVKLLEICDGAFCFDRFHRDCHIAKKDADWRYVQWLEGLIGQEKVFGLFWQGSLAGFIAHEENKLVLHAVAEKFRGRGLAKYWWSAVCDTLFRSGHEQVESSISVANVAALNLYASLNFSFSEPHDLYHAVVKDSQGTPGQGEKR